MSDFELLLQGLITNFLNPVSSNLHEKDAVINSTSAFAYSLELSVS